MGLIPEQQGGVLKPQGRHGKTEGGGGLLAPLFFRDALQDVQRLVGIEGHVHAQEVQQHFLGLEA